MEKAIQDEEIDEERKEDYTPAILFTLLNRSGEAIEIYDIEFSHLSTSTNQDYFCMASSVPIPYLLKPYDYQNFHIAINKEHSFEFLSTWQSRKVPKWYGLRTICLLTS